MTGRFRPRVDGTRSAVRHLTVAPDPGAARMAETQALIEQVGEAIARLRRSARRAEDLEQVVELLVESVDLLLQHVQPVAGDDVRRVLLLEQLGEGLDSRVARLGELVAEAAGLEPSEVACRARLVADHARSLIDSRGAVKEPQP